MTGEVHVECVREPVGVDKRRHLTGQTEGRVTETRRRGFCFFTQDNSSVIGKPYCNASLPTQANQSPITTGLSQGCQPSPNDWIKAPIVFQNTTKNTIQKYQVYYQKIASTLIVRDSPLAMTRLIRWLQSACRPCSALSHLVTTSRVELLLDV